MDDKLRELGRASVRVAAVPEQELGEVAELRHGEVSCKRGLFALLSNNADTWGRGMSMRAYEKARKVRTDVCGLDHADVITSVSDAADPLLGELANQARNVGLLRWRASTCDHSGELRGDLDELVPEHVEAELKHVLSQTMCSEDKSTDLERLSIDDETAVELVLEEFQLVPYLIGRLDYTWSVNTERQDNIMRHPRFAT